MLPLSGLKVIELAALGPVPFCAMMLADMGADVVRVERTRGTPGKPAAQDSTLRNRRSITLNLKAPEAVTALLRLVAQADVLLEGFRPGVAERLGVGPETCRALNARLVYGRMTGWGQDGPMAGEAGRDINYLALSGALHMIGERGGNPLPPLNLVGDMGSGGMLLLGGVLAALHAASRSGAGQVVDAAMLDGTIANMAYLHNARHESGWHADEPGEHLLAGAAPFYRTYRTADDRFIAVGAIDPAAWHALLGRLGLPEKHQRAAGASGRPHWATAADAMASRIRELTRDEVISLTAGTDCCVTPVLTMDEARAHPQNQARGTYVRLGGLMQAAPAPRFSAAGIRQLEPPAPPGRDTREILGEAGFSASEIEQLERVGALGGPGTDALA